MQIGRKLKINHKKFKDGLICVYYNTWNGIPLFVTKDYNNIFCMTFKNGEAIIVISDKLLSLYSNEFLEGALWHEVSHLYFKDFEQPWKIEYEYRADEVGAYMTSFITMIHSLEISKQLYKSQSAIDILNKRIEHLKRGAYTLGITPIQMLSSIKPAEVVEKQ